MHYRNDTPPYKGFYLNPSRHGMGYAPEILERLLVLMCFIAHQYPSGQFIRLDLRQPLWFAGEDFTIRVLIPFIRDFKQELKRQEKCEAYYLWAREQDSTRSSHSHYHFVWLLGNKANRPYEQILELSERVLGNKLGGDADGLIHFCKTDEYGRKQKNGRFFKEKGVLSESEFRECFRWGAYLAKNWTKNSLPFNTNRFNSSNLPDWAHRFDWENWIHHQFSLLENYAPEHHF